MVKRKKGSGGKREGSGKPQKYGQKTVTVFGRRIPFKHEDEYRLWHSVTCKPLIDNKLKTWEVSHETPDKQK